jgi:hypothetical protein
MIISVLTLSEVLPYFKYDVGLTYYPPSIKQILPPVHNQKIIDIYTEGGTVGGVGFKTSIYKDEKYHFTSICYYKLELRPMSDLMKYINIGGQMIKPINELFNLHGSRYPNLSHMLFDSILKSPLLQEAQTLEMLYSWHFDVFGLMKKGSAINIYDIPAIAQYHKS